MPSFQDREILIASQEKGGLATLLAFFRLSGPGWLQSAITLGGGSLIGCLYLGMLGGTQMLWLQLVAIAIGIIMLAAISYVTLSTDQRPYEAINDHVNPVLGVGWVTATVLANMIWILPQFSLCYDALDKNLIPGGLGDQPWIQALVSIVIAILALAVVIMSFNPGTASRVFDFLLKGVIAGVLICFVGVVVWLARTGNIDWAKVLAGFIPDFSLWSQPSNELSLLIESAEGTGDYWKQKLIQRQRESMISVTATAVGLNMTFLLPYSMLARGWDKPFRGLARFDLFFGLGIPFLIVTTCIVIASSHAFHAQADELLLSNQKETVRQSVMFSSLTSIIEEKLLTDKKAESEWLNPLNDEITELERQISKLEDKDELKAANSLLSEVKEKKADGIANSFSGWSDSQKKLAVSLVKPNIAQLSSTLKPIFGESQFWAQILLGIGALGMGFSTIVILSLTNSLAVAEIYGDYRNFWARVIGAIAALGTGVCWFFVWSSGSKTYLIIVASTFGAILLPIAYIAFFALMNSQRLLGAEKPTGAKMWIWNILMAFGVVGAIAQAYGGLATKINEPVTGPLVIGGCVTFFLLAIVGFSARPDYDYGDAEDSG